MTSVNRYVNLQRSIEPFADMPFGLRGPSRMEDS
jgi:hypothetical protein